MQNELYINNKDAWNNWRIRLDAGSYNNLLLPAPNKEFIENKSRLEHGKTVIYNNPKSDEREIQIIFAITCDSKSDYLSKYNSFVEELSKGKISLRIVSLNTTYNLTYRSCSSLSSGTSLRAGRLTVRFNEPNPMNRTQNPVQ